MNKPSIARGSNDLFLRPFHTSNLQGAKVYLNGEKQKTANDEANSSGLLRCKKAGNRIQRGATVILKVRNSDGTESVEFSYTRPEQ